MTIYDNHILSVQVVDLLKHQLVVSVAEADGTPIDATGIHNVFSIF